MRIVLYNINSFGGNYIYSKYLFKAFTELNEKEIDCTCILPRNADTPASEKVKKILIADLPGFRSAFLRKCHFAYRSIVNPLIFWLFLLRQPGSWVLYNDFEQLSGILWGPLFKLLRYKHRFGIVMHDPDRDNFFPFKWLSILSIRAILWITDVLFYHEILPDKNYYKGKFVKVSIPHGIYYPEPVDQRFFEELKVKKGNSFLLGILGNIRKDKNYDFVLECLPHLNGSRLLVAGRPVNGSVPLEEYKAIIRKHDLAEKVIWEERYLTENELAASIAICDVIVIYYGRESISQSGILNIIAPYKKKLLISDSSGPIKKLVDTYQLGLSAAVFNKEAFIKAVAELQADEIDFNANWNSYMQYASWHNNVSIIIKSFKKIAHEA